MICAYEECNNHFIPKTHNQKYCCDECCRTATNLKIKQKYYDEKNRKNGTKRYCSNANCKLELSRYNSDKTCTTCQLKKEKEKTKFMLNAVKNVIG